MTPASESRCRWADHHLSNSLPMLLGHYSSLHSFCSTQWHYTPKHGSWLDMAESELGVLSSQCLDRRIPDQGDPAQLRAPRADPALPDPQGPEHHGASISRPACLGPACVAPSLGTRRCGEGGETDPQSRPAPVPASPPMQGCLPIASLMMCSA